MARDLTIVGNSILNRTKKIKFFICSVIVDMLNNYLVGELKRYVRSNTKQVNFLAIKVKFYERLLERGFKKWKLACLFNKR